MSTVFNCPNCSGPISIDNPGLLSVVCNYCNVIIYRDKSGLHAGKQAILPETNARLSLHAKGLLKDKSFTVVGHVHVEYALGYWDEWYVRLAEGTYTWLIEKEREMALIERLPATAGLPSPSLLSIAQTVEIDPDYQDNCNKRHVQLTVRGIDTATFGGFAGQIDRKVLSKESFTFAELATPDGGRLGFIRQSVDESVEGWIGLPLAHGDLSVQSNGKKENPVLEGSVRVCAGCEAPLEAVGDGKLITQVCPYCGTQHDVSATQTRVLGKSDSAVKAQFRLNIGDTAKFNDVSYEVCGRLIWSDNAKRHIFKYLFYNSQKGYLWVEQALDHFVLLRPTLEAPTTNVARLYPGDEVIFGGPDFRCHESGERVLVYVDGAIPWRLSQGYTYQFVNLVAPPTIFVEELHSTTLEYYEGTYLHPQEVARTLGIEKDTIAPQQVHGAQTIQRPWRPHLVLYCLALVGLAYLFWSTIKHWHTFEEERIYSDTLHISHDQISQISSYAVDPRDWGYELVIPQTSTSPRADKIRFKIVASCISEKKSECPLRGSWHVTDANFLEIWGGTFDVTLVVTHDGSGGLGGATGVERTLISTTKDKDGRQKFGMKVYTEDLQPDTYFRYNVEIFESKTAWHRPYLLGTLGLLLLFSFFGVRKLIWMYRSARLDVQRWDDVAYGFDNLDLSNWDYKPVNAMTDNSVDASNAHQEKMLAVD